jgi:hypothetical protein
MEEVEFLRAGDFANAVRPAFDPVAREFGLRGPRAIQHSNIFLEVRYDGDAASLSLTWDVRESVFDCVVERATGARIPDPRTDWLHLDSKWTDTDSGNHGAAELRTARAAFGQEMERQATGIRQEYGPVLRGRTWPAHPEPKQGKGRRSR